MMTLSSVDTIPTQAVMITIAKEPKGSFFYTALSLAGGAPTQAKGILC